MFRSVKGRVTNFRKSIKIGVNPQQLALQLQLSRQIEYPLQSKHELISTDSKAAKSGRVLKLKSFVNRVLV
ncbi:hypothetical protein TUM4445_18990 [Shewanella sp. MBTL60-112-B2]|nr:hypothetical protein TUM4444_15390 [Shewanella sp. MBTL60-112-B1]GIU32825.1 hypothetical protein TUM4445_18990 [Shewanella sp. MBTL60-112-B2]